MTALYVALAATAGGWFLKTGTDHLSERKEGRLAARAIYLELTANLLGLVHLQEIGFWTLGEGPHRHAWDSHAARFMGVASEEQVSRVAACYGVLEHTRRILLVLAEPEEEGTGDETLINFRGEEITVSGTAEELVMNDQATADVIAYFASALRTIGPLMYPWWRRKLRQRAAAGTLDFGRARGLDELLREEGTSLTRPGETADLR